MDRFAERVARLPRLGVGISTEFGASRVGTDPVQLRRAHPELVQFLEIGADVDRGIDADTAAWVGQGWPTTYHFLDLNLEEPEDLDQPWLDATVALARGARAAWLCGDAGLWHMGPRDRGHGTLVPPILCGASARAMVEAVVALRERSGFEVLPENPPAQVMVGDLHPLEYFGWVADRADCGLLLDLAHLAIVQRARGLAPTALLDLFPVERVVEVHVAGGSEFSHGGRRLIHDDHGPVVHDDTWALLEEVLHRATALRAVVIECERNPPEVVASLFRQVRAAVADAPGFRGPPVEPPPVPFEVDARPVDHRGVQRTLFRMSLDPAFAAAVRAAPPPELGEPAGRWLREVDPTLLEADPDRGRVRQLVGNVALELQHTVRAAGEAAALDLFPASPELHHALGHDTPLVLAFAAYLDRVLPPAHPARALLTLDAAMAAVRRARTGPPTAAPALAATARCLTLPEGTAAWAAAVRDDPVAPAPTGTGSEDVVVALAGGEVRVEVLPPALAELVRAAPLTAEVLDAFAARHEVERAEVEALVDELLRDGVLSR